jgi:hypothetical protein
MANLNDVEFMGRTIRVNEVGYCCACCGLSCIRRMPAVLPLDCLRQLCCLPTF